LFAKIEIMGFILHLEWLADINQTNCFSGFKTQLNKSKKCALINVWWGKKSIRVLLTLNFRWIQKDLRKILALTSPKVRMPLF